jgi:LPXTG-motif cell wall-anchored protein
VASRRPAVVIVALAAALGLAVGSPLAGSAATPGVGDVSDAVRYDVTGPFGAPIAELSGDDDAVQTLTAPFPINFFGQASAGLCITTNGGFYPVETDTDGCSNSFDQDLTNLALSSSAPMIAALAADNDLGACADGTPDGWGTPCEIYFGTTTIDGRDAFVITWYRVPMYTDGNDGSLANTYQIVIIKRDTGDDTVGWDFDIEFNYATVQDAEDGYLATNPAQECDSFEDVSACRWGVGWANFIPGTPDTADSYELFAATPITDLLDGGARSLTANSLNSPVLGRYTFGMVDGATVGFSVPVLGGAAALPATGAEPAPLLWGGAVALLLAGLALIAARRRRA